MKKVLILTYYWPPSGGPGSLRMLKLAEHLPGYGWKPFILTVRNGEYPFCDDNLDKNSPDELSVYKTKCIQPFTAYKLFTGKKRNTSLPEVMLIREIRSAREKISTWIRANLVMPDARIGWLPFAVTEGLKILKKEKIDLIYSSSPPHSLQLAGMIIKKRTGIPWIADLRDPWSDIHFYAYSKRNAATGFLDTCLEKLVLQKTDHITAVSPGLADTFSQKISKPKNHFSVLYNSFDETDFNNSAGTDQGIFRILFAGNLIEPQNPMVLFQSLAELSRTVPETKEKIQIEFIGSIHPFVLQSIQRYQLAGQFSSLPFMSRTQICRKMTSAALLVAVIPKVPANSRLISGKLFDYIGSGSPVLLIGPPQGNAAKIISNLSNGKVCDYSDTKTCTAFIQQMFNNWRHGRKQLSDFKERRPYSISQTAQKLAGILNRFSE